MNKDAIEVLDLYVYNIAFANNFPFATAVSMLKSVVSVILLFAANTLSSGARRIYHLRGDSTCEKS